MADNFTDTFTKEETIKALRCCYSDEDLCSICSYKDTMTSCTQLLKRDAFDIIKSQEQFIKSQNELISKLALECKKAKIESYKEFADKLKAKAEIEALYQINAKSEKEIYELRKELLSKENLEESFKKSVKDFDKRLEKTVKLERVAAYKRFAERLKNKWFDEHYDSPDVDFSNFVDNLLKELVGENHDR